MLGWTSADVPESPGKERPVLQAVGMKGGRTVETG